MSGLHIWLFLIATFAVILAVHGNDIDSVLEKVPASERKAFLKYHLTLGYELSNVDILRNKKIPQELKELPATFSVEMYQQYRKDHLINEIEDPSGRENIVCFPNGECIDIDDPGVHPYNNI